MDARFCPKVQRGSRGSRDLPVQAQRIQQRDRKRDLQGMRHLPLRVLLLFQLQAQHSGIHGGITAAQR